MKRSFFFDQILRLLCTVLLAAAFCADVSAQNVSIQMQNGEFRVEGWDASRAKMPSGGWGSVFAVYVGLNDVPPMLGAYSVQNGRLIFRPQFPVGQGVPVRAAFHPPGIVPVNATFQTPAATVVSSTKVEHVYPSSDVLPANELKFYLYFSAAMTRGEALQHIRLLNANGSAVKGPFLEINQELWNPDGTRLTVFFDPGRIKRGVLPNVEMGMALEPGKTYTLVVDKSWQDGHGAPLVQGFKKTFRVTAPQRQPVETKDWKVTPPSARKADALTIRFPRPLDFALLQRFLNITGPSGRVVGMINVTQNETEWSFTPRDPWKSGSYQLVVNTDLEDLAGNKVGVPFDVDTFQPVTQQITTQTVSLNFQVH